MAAKKRTEKRFPEAKTDKTSMDLPCDLTQEELVKRGEALSSLISDHTLLESRAKEVSKEFKDKVSSIALTIREVSHVIANKRETRKVQCMKTWDYKRGVVEIHRNDTGELVSSRSMTPEERQGNLFDFKAPLREADGEDSVVELSGAEG